MFNTIQNIGRTNQVNSYHKWCAAFRKALKKETCRFEGGGTGRCEVKCGVDVFAVDYEGAVDVDRVHGLGTWGIPGQYS